jgi:hypothetical protein
MDADDASSAEMRRRPPDPDPDPLALDEAALERLLAGALPPAQAPPGYEKVAALLAAAAAAPTPEELAGQAAALAELRAVTRPRRAARTRQAARPPRRRWAGLAAVALVGALVTGGVAAATGHLPAPVRKATRTILGTASDAEPATPAPSGRQPAPDTPGSASADATTGPKGPRSTGAAGHGPGSTAAGPAGGVDGERLCRAYLAGKGDEQGKKLDAAAFQDLAELAGGAEQIPAYCEGVQPERPKPKEKPPEAPPDDQGQGQEPGGPPTSTGDQGQGASGARSPSR